MNTKQLVNDINKIKHIAMSQQHSAVAGELDILSKRVADNTFRTAVIGEFSSGKSTFINAIIGRDVLLHASNETTAAITYISHVPESNPRRHTCEITFRSGERRTLDDPSKLADFTTVQSGNNVAENVESVTIFETIPGVSVPFIIVDTPGLNGVADLHRDITLNEVRQAHACIYVLSEKGLKDSDRQSIELLKKYQSKFIFVQNFIDKLDVHIGDTPEKRYAENMKNIGALFEGQPGYSFELCGISALKALCYCDKSIKKLYASDFYEISDERRSRFREESNFDSFLEIIRRLVESGEYKEIIVSSAIQCLVSEINELLSGLEAQNELNASLRQDNDETRRRDTAKKALEKLEQNIERRKKELRNFINSCDVDNRRFLTETARTELGNIADSIKRQIQHVDIKNYNDYKNFRERRRAEPHVYYSRLASDMVNSFIQDKLRVKIQQSLEHMYCEALSRIESFHVDIDTAVMPDIRITGEHKAEVNIKGEMLRDTIQKNELNKTKLEKESSVLNSVLAADRAALSAANADIDRERQRESDIRIQREQALDKLGSRPVITQHEKEHVTYQERTGFFGSIIGFFAGDKKIVTKVMVNDEDAEMRAREWDAAKRQIIDSSVEQLQDVHSRIDYLEEQRCDLERSCEENSREQQRYTARLNILGQRIAEDRQTLDELSRKFNEELYEAFIKNIMYQIDSIFTDSLSRQLAELINRQSETNLPEIHSRVMQAFDFGVEARRKSLLAVISSSEAELEKKYYLLDDEIRTLNNILDSIKGV